MKEKAHRLSDSMCGFALPEFLVSMTLTLMVLAGIYQFSIGSQRIYVSQEELMNMDQQARVAMDAMIRSIRMAGSDPFGSALDPNVTNSVQFPLASQYAIRVLADLPQDTWDDAGNPTPDGDSFDINEDGDDIWEDNENENGDGMLLPANADIGEDIYFYLSPSDSSFLPTGSGPWTLMKRESDGAGSYQNLPLASNVMKEDGSPGLEFRYILKYISGNPNRDTLPTPFHVRWDGIAGTGVALNSSSYTLTLDKRKIYRVLIRLSLRSSNRDRTGNQYRFITLESDIHVRTQS